MTNDGQRVVVVTGASAGVGRATAIKFAEEGAAVALLARGKAGLEGAARDVKAAGGTALVIETDVADNDAVEGAALRAEHELGPIDVWVNVAFSSVFATFLEISPDEFERTTDVTYQGYVNGTRAALKRMIERDSGTVIQVSSALAHRGIPLQSAYCGAKHAVKGFTESVRCELLHDKSNVRIAMVDLPAVNTPQFDWVLSRLPKRAQPVPPIYQPEVPAAVVVKASHSNRRVWWVGVPTVATILGNRLIPGILDHYLGRTGFSSQQTDEATSPDRPSNLFTPVDADEDAGARGSFDAVAKNRSFQVPLSANRRFVWPGVAAGAIAVVGAVCRQR